MVDVLEEFYQIINNNWNESISKPEIIKAIDYRSLDLLNKDYVILNTTTVSDEFLGIGGKEFKCNVAVSIVVKTARSRERLIEIFEEVRRILRSKENWGSFRYILVGKASDLSDRERKIYTYAFDAIAWKTESL